MKNYLFCMFLLATATTAHTHTFVMRAGVTAIGIIAAKAGLDLMNKESKSSLRWAIDRTIGVAMFGFGSAMVVLEPIFEKVILASVNKYYQQRPQAEIAIQEANQ